MTNPIKKWFRNLIISIMTNPFFLKHPIGGDRYSLDFIFGYKVDWDEKKLSIFIPNYIFLY
jgi:hypothetical protein